MDKPHPNNVILKTRKCPDCKGKLEVANLKVLDGLVQAACHNEKCDYSIDLFWLPAGHPPGMN